nr:immunoglobulin heavy chain junction region [Macaca mulatta]
CMREMTIFGVVSTEDW